jgi:hypothetical protein
VSLFVASGPDVQTTLQQAAHPVGVLERPIDAFVDSSPQALVPIYRQLHLQEFLPRHSAILARLSQSKTHPLAVVPSSRAGSAASNDQPVAPRHAASSPDSRPTLTPRSEPRAELRHRARRALQAMPGAPNGAAFTLKTSAVLLLGPR